MASAQQSALDFIRNGRSQLIEGLQNLSVVVEALCQHMVLTVTEVNYIESETDRFEQSRKMLDIVIKKGETACYKLLSILEKSRFRTFRRAGSQHTDLHHWVSCFSFREDPQLQSDLKAGSDPCLKYETQLRRTAMQILDDKWNKKMDFLKNEAKRKSFTYIPLVLDTDTSEPSKIKIKAYKKSRSKKLKTYIPTDKKNISPDDLLKNNEKKILLIGKPGIGKTTVTQEVLRLWAEREDSQVKYMFHFDEPLMRTMSQSSSPETLKTLLFDMYLRPDEGIDEVLSDIEENSENVVIIFDGIMNEIDNPVIKRIMEKDLLCDAKILTTCRPEAEDSDFLSDWPSYRVEVRGFNGESIHAYFKLMLGSSNDTNCSALNNPELFSLCHVPMYAFIVTACISFSPSEAENQPCTITEMYVRIFRYCMKRHGNQNVEHLDKYIHDNKGSIMDLAVSSYKAMLAKTVNLTELDHKDKSVQHSFLTSMPSKDPSTSSQTVSAFLHNTMQEFWSALFLLMNPDNIGHVLGQCQTDDGKHLKYIITFLCGVLSWKMVGFMKCLVSEDQLRTISDKYFEEIVNAFLYTAEQEEQGDPEPSIESENLLFVCQCLYEYQSAEACLLFLRKIEYELDLSGVSLDPYDCCAVSYVISQSTEQNVELDLMSGCTVSDSGLQLILGSLSNLKCLRLSSSLMQCHVWRVAFHAGPQTDFNSLLRLFGSEMHLSVQAQEDQDMFQQAGEVLTQMRADKVKLCLHLDTHHAAKSLLKTICGNLPNIAAIRFISPEYPRRSSELWKKNVTSFQLDLFVQGALYEMETGHRCVQGLLSVLGCIQKDFFVEQCKFVQTLYSLAKGYKTPEGLGILPALQPVFQAIPSVWVVDLSERKTSLILEVLKLQKVKKPVELWWSEEEGELKTFLQCLPYLSELRFNDYIHIQHDDTRRAIKVLVDLFIHASLSGEETMQMLCSACCYSTFPFAAENEDFQSVFLLDLFCYVTEYESQTGESVLPALLPIFQSAPAVWVLDLSKGKASILLQVLKLQVVKKPLELRGWSDEESDLRSFLQCLPYVLQLRFNNPVPIQHDDTRGTIKVFVDLFIHASLSGEETLQMLWSVCCYSTFPFAADNEDFQSVFLLELFCYVTEYESQTGQSVLPALLPIFQSAPAVWVLDLSKGKASILLQVLKLQVVKKPLELRGWSDEESDLRSFLQCLPYVLQLRFNNPVPIQHDDTRRAIKVLADLFIHASLSGEETLQRLWSVCCYSTFPFAADNEDLQSVFLLDLFCYVTEYESQTGKSVLPAFQPFFQSAPAVWVLDLSKGKASILLQVLELQGVKKPLELRGWSDEESDLRSFLQCLPYVLQLRFGDSFLIQHDDTRRAKKVLVDLFIHASLSGEETLQMLWSVCCYSTFPFAADNEDFQSVFLLDLFCYVTEYESQTGQSVLPAFQPIFQSAPAVWVLDFSKGKASILLQVLKLQVVKKPLELRGWSDEESDLRSFLQCLPYVLQLSCDDQFFQSVCEVLSADSSWDPEPVSWLLRPLDFTITLSETLPSRICRAVESVFSQTDPTENLSLTLVPQSISSQGAALLLSKVTRLQKLRMNEQATLKMARMARLNRSHNPVMIEELSLVLSNPNPPEGALCRLLNSLVSLLRVWTVQSLDLTECKIEGHSLICLLCHNGPLSIRMCEENLQQLAEVVYEAQDEGLTQLFLEKIGEDLSPCSLPWDVLHYLLQSTKKTVTLGFWESRLKVLHIPHLLLLLDKIRFKGIDSQFVMTALKEIYERRAGHLVAHLVRSSDNWINLAERELDTCDCAALRFALHYSDNIKLNLLCTIIPKEEMEGILQLLHRVSELRVDRKLLLNLLHACLVSREQEPAASLLEALHHKLDFSCSSAMDLFQQDKGGTLHLSDEDCRAISSAIQLSACDTELIIKDCQADDSALEELFPALPRVHLSLGKPLLLQLLSLTRRVNERECWSRALSLSRAFSEEINLSHTPMDLQTCGSLAMVLDNSEKLSQLDLSHCQLTDNCLELLLPHIHKALVLDLSNNDITDQGALRLHEVIASSSNFTQTIRLFNNRITEIKVFKTDKRYEMGPTQPYPTTSNCGSTHVMRANSKILPKKINPIEEFDPERRIHKDKICYRLQCVTGGMFQCRDTGLVFGMKGRGCVEYSMVHWDMQSLSNTRYVPAGPLFDIETPEGEMYQLQLPHCETKADAVGDLLVAHICKNSLEFLTPIKWTRTHIAVRVHGLSKYGIVGEEENAGEKKRGQVLLFLEPDISDTEQRLWVFLLSQNVPLTEIKEQQKEFKFIRTSSSCSLRSKTTYNLTSKKAKTIQPKNHVFYSCCAGDHHASFEVFLNNDVTKMRMKINKKAEGKVVWNRLVILKTQGKQAQENLPNAQGNRALTENDWRSSLGDILHELTKEEVKRLKGLMRAPEKLPPIPKGKLEKVGREKLVDLMMENWGFQRSICAMQGFMGKLPRNDEAVTSLLKPYLKQLGFRDKC